jgi:hypothetical protein
MSNGHKMELIVNEGKSEIYFNYWDWLSGENDTTFIIRNGKAFAKDGKEVDLAKELDVLAKRVDKQVKTFYKGKSK